MIRAVEEVSTEKWKVGCRRWRKGERREAGGREDGQSPADWKRPSGK
jgi:hypothetical protein